MAAVKARAPTRRSAVGPPSRARRREQAVRRGRKEREDKDIGPGGASAGDFADGPPGASVLDLTAGREARACCPPPRQFDPVLPIIKATLIQTYINIYQNN